MFERRSSLTYFDSSIFKSYSGFILCNFQINSHCKKKLFSDILVEEETASLRLAGLIVKRIRRQFHFAENQDSSDGIGGVPTSIYCQSLGRRCCWLFAFSQKGFSLSFSFSFLQKTETVILPIYQNIMDDSSSWMYHYQIKFIQVIVSLCIHV